MTFKGQHFKMKSAPKANIYLYSDAHHIFINN